MKKLSLLCMLGLVALSVTLAACGDDGDEPQIDAPPDNSAPVASFTMDPDCTTDQTTEVTFTSTSTDADGDNLTCSWTFDSGTPETSAECTTMGVTFPSAAPYDVTLTVDDGNDGQATATMQIAPCP